MNNTYNYFIIDINEEQIVKFVNEEQKNIELLVTPTRGSLISVGNSLYSVVDIVLHDNATPKLILMNVNEDVPPIYHTLKW